MYATSEKHWNGPRHGSPIRAIAMAALPAKERPTCSLFHSSTTPATSTFFRRRRRRLHSSCLARCLAPDNKSMEDGMRTGLRLMALGQG
ncbi:hypothetical protein IMZ48_14535, partial [Candidatus Bathyarchaeota archaeon]|nr:hypothetical protein [Candidatus Bathyarchaeota archaeon]